MPNPDPYHARLSRKRRRTTGDLNALRRKLWGAICEADDLIGSAETDEIRLKAIHALVQAGMAYAKICEVGEYEARLAAIEQQLRLGGRRLG